MVKVEGEEVVAITRQGHPYRDSPQPVMRPELEVPGPRKYPTQ
jgi:hypothetical protein